MNKNIFRYTFQTTNPTNKKQSNQQKQQSKKVKHIPGPSTIAWRSVILDSLGIILIPSGGAAARLFISLAIWRITAGERFSLAYGNNIEEGEKLSVWKHKNIHSLWLGIYKSTTSMHAIKTEQIIIIITNSNERFLSLLLHFYALFTSTQHIQKHTYSLIYYMY